MKILVFAPHAQIWKHAFPEAILVESLQKKGHEIVYIRCGGAFCAHCIPMITNHIPYDAPDSEKKRLCGQCRSNAKVITESFNFPNYELDGFISAADIEEMNQILRTTTQENFGKIILDGMKVGEIALYQVLLRYKQSKENSFSERAWQEYLAQLNVTLRAFFSLRKIIKQEKPDRIMQYSGMYSVNAICRNMGAQHNIPVYFLHAGLNQRDRLQSLIMAKDHTLEYIKSLFDSWEERYKQIPCDLNSMRKVTDNFIDITQSRSFLSYSQSKSATQFNIFSKFAIPIQSKVVVALMSSYDEHLAANAVGAYRHHIKPLFRSQIEWIRELIPFFAKRPDLFLIIRVHPREFPTRREKTSTIKSQHAKDIEAEFVNLPANVIINWPDDMVSFYDLLNQTNLFLNAFSTAAREITMLGLPALTYHNEDVVEPVSITYSGNSVEEYLGEIDRLMQLRFDPERIRLAYRWRALEQVHSHVRIAESYQERDDLLTFNEKVIKGIKRVIAKFLPRWEQKFLINKRANFLQDAELIEQTLVHARGNIADTLQFDPALYISEKQELENLRNEIGRLIKSFYPNSDNMLPNSLNAHLLAFINERD
jgi:hypothetical protein